MAPRCRKVAGQRGAERHTGILPLGSIDARARLGHGLVLSRCHRGGDGHARSTFYVEPSLPHLLSAMVAVEDKSRPHVGATEASASETGLLAQDTTEIVIGG